MKVTKRNFNSHDNYDGINQFREGQDFDDVILICYDKSSTRSNNEFQRELSFGLMFVKRDNEYFDVTEETLDFQMYPYNSEHFLSTNLECFGATDTTMDTPRFKIPVETVHIKSNNVENRNIFGSHNSCMGVAMYPLNDFSEYGVDDTNRDYRYDVTEDECDNMSFYYLVSSDDISMFNRQTRNSTKVMSNYNMVSQNIHPVKIGLFIQQNNNILKDKLNMLFYLL
jgi:hypothetical protein